MEADNNYEKKKEEMSVLPERFYSFAV